VSDRIAYGGKMLYGARLGILATDNLIPSMPGCARHARTWPFPVIYEIVPGASARRVVLDGGEGLLDAATGGFCSLFQEELAAHCKVPVATSSLMQIPLVQQLLPPGKRVGVVTIHGAKLDARHLVASKAPPDTPVIGTEGRREFTRALLNAEPSMDVAKCELDVLDAGQELVAKHPDIGAIVLECHDFAPYAAALRNKLGMPVYSVYSFLTWFHAGLEPRNFGPPGSADPV
jgi:hypothetical protein